MFFIHFCRWSWTYCNPMTHFLSTIPSSETKKGEGGREEKKVWIGKKEEKKKPMAYTSKNCRHFFTKDYRRFFNTTSIQTRLQRPILVNVYDRYIHTRERERERERERDRSRERNSQLRGGTITLKETGSHTKGGNYTEKREMDWHTYRESCWKKIIFETR